jgi:hypothetical protein
VVKIQGVAITAGAATLAAGLANATTRTATAAVLAGEETVFTGSTAAQTLTFPVTPQVSTINTVLNLSSVTVTVAAGAGNTLNSFGTVGSVVLPVNGYAQFVFVGTVWYCIDSNAYANLTGAPVPANGYGITGNTGATPTPAVILTSASSFIGAPVTITGITPVNVTSLSLAAGTWLLMGQALIDNTVAATPITAALGIGTTTASFAGALTGAETLLGGATAVTAHFASIACSCVVVVAAPTTYFLVASLVNAAATGSVLDSDTVGKTSGLTAVRIA